MSMATKKLKLETKFPAGRVRTDSTHISETFGAFGEMELARNNASKQLPIAEYGQQYSPAFRNYNYGMRAGTADESIDSAVRCERDGPLLEATNGRSSAVYRLTTTRSEASAASTKKSYGKLSEVYSNSGDTIEFAHNFGNYINTIVSPYVWIVLLLLLGLWSIVLILVGSFNLPFCSSQPMIPIYLIVAGSLFILFAAIRIYNLWPLPDGARRTPLTASLACRGIEGLLCLAIIVWLILGCIWTYGARKYVHFEDAMFERHFCDEATYWMAFANATLHLAIIALTILG
uniref:Uncharacterized protein n=1 Tax=Parascaris univalens TaxID=6257 RepID=A0A915B7P6_PARUN